MEKNTPTMMNNYDENIHDLIRKRVSDWEKILMDAFHAHFGFPITQVEDKESLERIVQEGNPEVEYRYRGETFLSMWHERDIEFNKAINGYEVRVNLRYKMF